MKLRKKKTLYIGHRGSESGKAVENTYLAYLGGAKDRYDGLECDIQITKDNKYVCYHNPNLEEHSRFEITKTIAHYTYDELKEMTLYDVVQNKEVTGKICLFEEYLQVIKDFDIYGIIEIKNCDKFFEDDYFHLRKVVEIIKEKGLEEKVSIISFVMGYLLFLRENYPSLHLELIYDRKVTKEIMDKCFENKLNLDIRFDKCRRKVIKAFHKHDLEVNSWTVNFKILSFLFKLWNIDMITTDCLRKPKRYK